jgi:uncharacterized delta-60 repeat protein
VFRSRERRFGSTPRKAPSRRRPILEPLEDRTLLATFTVSSLADSGPGTLRQALLNAAATTERDTVQFAVAGTIQPRSALPPLTGVTLDGTTAPGFAGRPLLELDGSLAGNVSGLRLTGDSNTVQSLVINRWRGPAGVEVYSDRNVLKGNFIGTDLTGTQARPNAGHGVLITQSAPGVGGSFNLVGGNAESDGNVLSGNQGAGVYFLGSGGNNDIRHNRIGTGAGGTEARGNNRAGVIFFLKTFLPIAIREYVRENKIDYNIGPGVQVESNGDANLSGVTIQGNSFFANSGLAIDYGALGVTPNDDRDRDDGPNDPQNFPILGGVVRTANSVTVGGFLNSTPNRTFTIELYASAVPGPNGYGAAERYLGATTVTTDAQGNGRFNVTLPVSVAAGQFLTATATAPDGSTSEFSRAIAVSPEGTPATVQFLDASTRVVESDGVATLYVGRTGNLSGTVTVSYTTSDDTATAGSDYTAQAGTLTFAPNETVKTVTIPIRNDQVFEAPEWFTLTLSNPTGGAILGTTNPVEVIIQDDDPLDPSFGSGGRVTTDFTGPVADQARAVVTQPDGKVIVVGSSNQRFAVLRYHANGSLDTGFGSGGSVILQLTTTGTPSDRAAAVALQTDGKIVVAGTAENANQFLSANHTLVRLNPEGSLDTTFGGGGKVFTDLGGRDEGLDLVIQADGKVVVLGQSGGNVGLARYNADGTLDATFGTGGKVTQSLNTFATEPRLALQADGKLVVAYTQGFDTTADFALARFHPNGTLDSTFGTGGKVTTNFGPGSTDGANDVFVQADGKIVVVGSARGSGAAEDQLLAVARYNANGTPDTTFSGDGLLTEPKLSNAAAVTVQADGKILTTADGLSGGIEFRGLGVARFNPTGGLDPTFDGDGVAFANFVAGLGVAAFPVLALAPGGAVVAAGTSQSDFAVARFLATGTLDPGFDGDGKVTTGLLGSQADVLGGLVVLPGGKFVAAGSSGGKLALTRYHADGTLDTTFGTAGRVVTSDTVGDTVRLIVQADGKLLVATNSLLRFNSDGTLDTSFGTGGRVPTNFEIGGMAVQADGKIVVAGSLTFASGTAKSLHVARYNADGRPDTTFDGDGFVTTDFPGNKATGQNVVLQPDGKIVVVGKVEQTATPFDTHFAVARYHADGRLDPTFDGDGRVTTVFGPNLESEAAVAVVQADGKLLVAGTSGKRPFHDDNHFALARYHADGSLDTSFEGDGLVRTRFSTVSWDFVNAVLLLPDGKIVAVGRSFDTVNPLNSFALARYHANGRLDARFGREGLLLTDFGPGRDARAFSAVLQADGKMVAAGTVGGDPFSPTGGDFGLVRYLVDLGPEPPSDTAPPTWPPGSALTASALQATSLTLSWTAAQDNRAVTGYRVFRGNTFIAAVGATTRTTSVAGLVANTAYTFKVEAVDAAGNVSTTGPSVTITTPPAGGSPPFAPTPPADVPAPPDSTAGTEATFVTGVYRDGLGPTPDPAGLAFWSDGTVELGGAGRNVGQDSNPAMLSAGLETCPTVVPMPRTSAEARLRLIDAAYSTYLRRESDPAGDLRWLGLLQASFLMPDRLAEVFLDSQEYVSRQTPASPRCSP